MSRVLLALFISLLLLGPLRAEDAPAPDAVAPPPPCGSEPITIARMQWPSAAILAAIHAALLEKELGCVVSVVAGDLNATTSSMATTGRPLVAPEVWLGRVASIWNAALETGKLRQAAPSFSDGDLEGWFVPDYVLKDNPGLKSAADLKDYWQVFAGKSRKATFLSCPSDWACAVINRNLLKAYGIAQRFEVREPDNRFDLDKAIGEAVSRHDPLLFYYWQPNAVLAQLDFRALDMGAFDAKAMTCLAAERCPDPVPSAFPREPVVIVISDDLFALAPAVAAYFQRATLPLDEMNDLLARLNEDGGAPEDAARRFVETRAEIWMPWFDR